MKLLLPIVCVLAAGWALPAESPKGRMVLTVVARTQAQFELLKTAEDTDYELDFWTHPRLNANTDVMVSWERSDEIRQKWSDAGMQVKIMQEDVDKLIREVDAGNKRMREQSATPIPGFSLVHSYYRRYEDFVIAINELKNRFPHLVRFNDKQPLLPRTVEGRGIHFFEVGANYDDDDDEEIPVIFIEVMIHAREWITGGANLVAFDWLLNNYGIDEDATNMLDYFRFVVVPVANPDGYEYTWNYNRIWRKNRRPVSSQWGCYGVDLNRNFGAYFLGGASCHSDIYPGQDADSEYETQAIQALFHYYGKRVAIYLAVHAYSQLILLPWSYDSNSDPKDSFHKYVGEAMANAMGAVFGRNFTAGTPAATLGYTAGGTTVDWAMVQMMGFEKEDKIKRRLSMAYELRPKAGEGFDGFILDATEIFPAGMEYLQSLITLCKKYRGESSSEED